MQNRLRLPALMLAAAVLALPAHSRNRPTRSKSAAHKVAPTRKLPAGVDWSFIAANEGTTLYGTVLLRPVYSSEPIASRGQLVSYSRNQGRLIGYHVIGKSGVTIGTGVDLGQHDLARLPVSA